MGAVYRATCPTCGYNAEFNLGGGLMSIKPAFGIRALDEEDRAAVLKMQENGEIKGFLWENYLMRCPCCEKSLKQKTIVTVTDNDGVRHVFGDRCGECGAQLIHQKVAEDSVPCPECGERLAFDEIGLWD